MCFSRRDRFRALTAATVSRAAHAQTTAFHILGIDHVALAVADPAKSLAF
jgi:hypothetical protein